MKCWNSQFKIYHFNYHFFYLMSWDADCHIFPLKMDDLLRFFPLVSCRGSHILIGTFDISAAGCRAILSSHSIISCGLTSSIAHLPEHEQPASDSTANKIVSPILPFFDSGTVVQTSKAFTQFLASSSLVDICTISNSQTPLV